MSLSLRARVYKSPRSGTWFAYAHAVNHTNPARPFSFKPRIAAMPSQPEAMQWAYKLLADIDDELMDEVFESRASRRTQAIITMQGETI